MVGFGKEHAFYHYEDEEVVVEVVHYKTYNWTNTSEESAQATNNIIKITNYPLFFLQFR